MISPQGKNKKSNGLNKSNNNSNNYDNNVDINAPPNATVLPDVGEKKVWRPIWINDADMNCCLNCNSQFTTILRRHHCRLCGRIYCNNCSNKRQALPQLKYDKPVRICTRCADLSKYSKLAESNDPNDRIESSKGFYTLSLDELGRQMIISHYLDIIYSLFNQFNPTVYKNLTKAVLHLCEVETNRVDVLESNVLNWFEEYLLNSQIHDSEITLNISNCLEHLVNEENPLIKTFTEKCIHTLIEYTRSYNNQIRLSTSMILLNLTKNNLTREEIIKNGGIQVFIALMLSEDSILQIASTQAFSIISSNPKYQRKMVEGSTLPPLILMLSSTSIERVLLYTTQTLALLSENKDNQLSFGQVGIKPIINILHYQHNSQIPIYAATCLYHLSFSKSNYNLLIQQELFDYLSKIIVYNYANTGHELLQVSLKLLGNLSQLKEGKMIVRRNQSVLNVLRIMVHTTNQNQSLATVIFNNCEAQ